MLNINHNLGFFSAKSIQSGGTDIIKYEAQDKGKISKSLSKAISYERTPELFDTTEIQERDKELYKGIQQLKEADLHFNIERRGKPVVLTSYQDRIIHALSYAISQQEKTSEDVREKIKNPLKGGNPVTRALNITALTALIFGSTRARYKEIVIKELFNISQIRQVQIFGEGTDKYRVTAPLIMLGAAIEDLSPEKRNNLDYIEVTYGAAFFYKLTNSYAVITPKLFEVWRKGGRATELFNVLLSSIFSVYWGYRNAADRTEERLRKENKNLTQEKLSELIKEERSKAMTYSLKVSTIKNRVSTDYDSKRSYKARFWKDLENAIEGFKELNLIDEAVISKGTTEQVVAFILSSSYNFTTGGEEPRLLENEHDNNDSRISAF